MDHQSLRGLQQFKNHVGIKFQLYNSLFTSLPFHRIEKTGLLLSLLLSNCEDGYKKNLSPMQILEDFFARNTSFATDQEKADLMFRFVQYVERQVVLFDALEDAAFCNVNDVNGVGSMKHLESEVLKNDAEDVLKEKLKDFNIRLVLTAHPTQFYPGPVLGIINDLSRAVIENNASLINVYLQQLGKTPFFKKQQPTPYDEAVSLIWYLESVFYNAAGRIISYIKEQFPEAVDPDNPVITMGFWPGGDRDGNPNVTAGATLRVANSLKGAIVRSYYQDVRRLKKRLTFKGVDVILNELEKKLYNNIFVPGQKTELSKQSILEPLLRIRDMIIYEHNNLFLNQLDGLINKVHLFGLHFASLDIRQVSTAHTKVLSLLSEREGLPAKNYAALSDEEKIALLTRCEGMANPDLYEEPLVKDALESVRVMRTIQQNNGEQGCNRYVISHCNTALNVLEVYGLLLLNGWKKESLAVDIVPLFETIEDLKQAAGVMKTLYENKDYRSHLQQRKNKQTIMVGFSDGTKDGGYLTANWSIYKAKEELTRVSLEYGIDVLFFDGRGGPPARGGGKTHKFYASMGRNISNKEIQLTIQGQTVSSNFGTIDSARFNMEQLLSAGLSNELFLQKERTLTEAEENLLAELAEENYKAYKELKENPVFLDYLANISPLKFYNEANIGSRPSKRGNSARLSLDDLRAIPFVGSWSQLKQMVPGYYGVGAALQAIDKKGKLPEVQQLYRSSLFFKALLDNCEMAMKKCFFPLTRYLADDPVYGEVWNQIYDEYELTRRYLFQLSGNNELMADYPVEQLSVQMRERIVLPLTTIQQYAMSRLREMNGAQGDKKIKETYQRLIVRCSFGIINAGRNSA